MANNTSPPIEEIQLRKRARRRLIGAVTLVALMVAILPMVLDNDPKPIGPDVEINIPSSKNSEPFKSAMQPDPAQPVPVVEPSEKAPEPAPPAIADPSLAPKTGKTEVKPEPVMRSIAASKEADKEVKKAATEKQDKPEKSPPPAPKPPAKPEAGKPEASKPEASKPESNMPSGASQTQKTGSYVVLLGAFLGESNASQRQAKLKELGVKFYVEKIKSPTGDKIAVRAGPYSSREEAERALARLKSAGIQDGMVAEKK